MVSLYIRFDRYLDILDGADQDPDNSSNILDVYLNASYTKEGGGNSNYNREHTWPKSYGFHKEESYNYPYTDCHALFLALIIIILPEQTNLTTTAMKIVPRRLRKSITIGVWIRKLPGEFQLD
jgi:hypothetical protein